PVGRWPPRAGVPAPVVRGATRGAAGVDRDRPGALLPPGVRGAPRLARHPARPRRGLDGDGRDPRRGLPVRRAQAPDRRPRRGCAWDLISYQGTVPWRSKKPPVGPSGPMLARRTIASVPSATVCVPELPFRSVAV